MTVSSQANQKKGGKGKKKRNTKYSNFKITAGFYLALGMPISVWGITYTTILLLISSFPFPHPAHTGQPTQLVSSWKCGSVKSSILVWPHVLVWPEQHWKTARLTASWWFRPLFSRQKGRSPRFWLQGRLDQPERAKMRDNSKTHLHIPWLRDHVVHQQKSTL